MFASELASGERILAVKAGLEGLGYRWANPLVFILSTDLIRDELLWFLTEAGPSLLAFMLYCFYGRFIITLMAMNVFFLLNNIVMYGLLYF